MSVSGFVARKLVEQQVIKKEEYELYQYSINSLFELGGNILLTIIIGIVIGKMIPTLLFLGIVVPVRSFIGGCHARTTIGCFCMSIVVYLLCVLCPAFLVNIPLVISFAVVLICGMGIGAWAPVACREKPISDGIRKKMKTCSIISIVVLLLLYILFYSMGSKHFSIEIMLIMCYFLSTLIIEKIRKRA